MLARVTTGSGLRGALQYDLSAAKNGEPRGQWVAGSMIGTSREMARQAAAFRALRPDCRKAILRVSLSAAPQDGFLTEKKWSEVATDFLTEMGIDPQQHAWVAIRHPDLNKFGQPHDHIHLSVVRVSAAAQLWNQEFSAKRAIKATEILEEKHRLEAHAREPPDRRRPQKNEQEMKNRKGNIQMPREKITNAIDAVLAKHPEGLEFEAFKNEMDKRGVNLRAAVTQTGRLQGFSFEAEGIAFPGSKLGSDYGLSGLLQRGVRPPRDDAKLKPDTKAPKPVAADNVINPRSTQTARAAQQPQASQIVAAAKKKEQQAEDQEEMADDGPSPKTIAARQYRDQQHRRRMQLAQDKVTSSKFAKSLGLFAEAISHFTIEMICRFLEWLRDWLLQKLGVSVTQRVTSSPNGRRRVELQPDTDKIIEVEAKLIEPQPAPLSLDYRLGQAAEFVEQATRAANEKNFENLPGLGSEGRAELIAELQKPVPLEPVAEFPYMLVKKLNELEKCLVDHRRAAAAATAEIEKANTSASWAEMEEIRGELDELQIGNDAWLNDHPFQAKLGAFGPNADAIKKKKEELRTMRLKDEADSGKRKAEAAPKIKALETEEKATAAAVTAAKSEFFESAAQSRAFDDDPRLGQLPIEVPKRVQTLVQSVTTRMSGMGEPDIRSQIKSVREALGEWDEAAKTPLPSAPKSLQKDEQKEKQEQGPEDGFEVPR